MQVFASISILKFGPDLLFPFEMTIIKNSFKLSKNRGNIALLCPLLYFQR